VEETEVSDAQLPVGAARLNIVLSLEDHVDLHVDHVEHFGVDGDIEIQTEHRRRKVVPTRCWEISEDQENPHIS